MAYQKEQAERRRTVVETPNSKREVVHSEAVRYPERTGISGGVLAAIVVGVIALAAIAIVFVMNRQQDTTNANVASQPQTTIVEQPAQQPVPATQPPVVNNGQSAPAGSSLSKTSDDATIQAAIDKKLSSDSKLSSLGVTATVTNGKVTLTGTVKTEATKAQVERAVSNVKGVKSIDNQIRIG